MLAHVRQLPNFFIVGARRAGTASLAHYLEQHPAICFTEPRDHAFFHKDELHRLGIDYYIRTFCHVDNKAAWLGEASSTYFAYPHIIGPRLRAQFGDAPVKFIVLLREPVARAWSHYLSCVNHGQEKRDFATALAEERHEVPASETRYFQEGCYVNLLTEWQTYYPMENFLLLLTEDMAANPIAQVRRAFMWLGADASMPVNVSERLNVARYSRSPKIVDFMNNPPAWLSGITKQIWPEVWRRRRIRRTLREQLFATYRTPPLLDPAIAADLRQRYRGEVLALSKLLGRYLSNWLAEEESPSKRIIQLKSDQISY